MTGSYVNSSLWRYIEEMVAEGISKGRVDGFWQFFDGFAFPMRESYVYLMRGGADPLIGDLAGRGFLPEIAGLLVTGPVMGVTLQLWHSRSPPNR